MERSTKNNATTCLVRLEPTFEDVSAPGAASLEFQCRWPVWDAANRRHLWVEETKRFATEGARDQFFALARQQALAVTRRLEGTR